MRLCFVAAAVQYVLSVKRQWVLDLTCGSVHVHVLKAGLTYGQQQDSICDRDS